jgi:hypothetical protein
MRNLVVRQMAAVRSLHLRLCVLWVACVGWLVGVVLFTVGHMLLSVRLSAYDVAMFLMTLLLLPFVLLMKPRAGRPARQTS